MGVAPALIAPEPNTWREVLGVTEGRPERRIAVQEYGRANPNLIQGLDSRGASVTAVRVYQWALPEDTGPLRAAVRELAAGKFAAVLFTTAVQLDHLLRVAEEEGLVEQALRRLGEMFVGSIGPTTSEALEEFGVRVTMEPSHPKMGFLVREAGAAISY
jgi:uroporphyrinogen-III synthase